MVLNMKTLILGCKHLQKYRMSSLISINGAYRLKQKKNYVITSRLYSQSRVGRAYQALHVPFEVTFSDFRLNDE